MIASELIELSGMLDRVQRALERFWKDRCVEIVRHNGELSMLMMSDAEGMRSSVDGMLMRGIGRDAYDETIFESIQANVCGCQGIVEHAVEALLTQMEVDKGERQSTLDLKRKMEALLARRREHALHSPQVRQQVWDITGGKCIYCDVELTRERDPAEPHRCFEVDHIVARANGGPDHLSNYVPSCSRCNTSKSSKSIFDYLRRRGDVPALKVVGGSEA